MFENNWRPQTSQEVLVARSKIITSIRNFFSRNNVLEVDLPVLSSATVSDPFITSFTVNHPLGDLYLQTSPEYLMKRLIAETKRDYYYLGKAFRADEVGRLHNPEFTILEWYRCDCDEFDLMDEIISLIHVVSKGRDCYKNVTKLSYKDCYQNTLSIDPHALTTVELQTFCKLKIGSQWAESSRKTCLDLIFNHLIQPALPPGVVFVYEFPECQAGLSKLKRSDLGYCVSRRFEVFINNIEIANGYFELNDSDQQRERFESDNLERREQSKDLIQADKKLLDALDYGLPNCSGVAIGVDRLIMCLLNLEDISEVMPFPWMYQ